MSSHQALAPDLNGIDFETIEATLIEAAEAAARETLPRFRTVLSVDNKYAVGFDPVTEADRGGETAIRGVIGSAFPDHAIVGEEWGTTGDSRFKWIIDPVDGTRSFISGVPLWGTLIGFEVDGRSVAGIMTQPFIGEIFLASPGKSVYRKGSIERRLETSGTTAIAEARVFTTTPALFRTPHQQAVWQALESRAQLVRYGTDCYGYALVASGQADLVVEPGLQPYDIAALIPIIEQAGGHVATWEGGRPEPGGSIIAAASLELLEITLELIRGAKL
jgi:histidinol phosphatase-like enzyme (inositol monophosphatase family)